MKCKRAYSYQQRMECSKHPTAKKLFQIMGEKKTNLAIAADVLSCERLLEIADATGPEICVLKTHVDILEDFTFEAMLKLRALADKHHFLIFEDRKFADIGNTVLHQFGGGIYKIADWADLINAHIVPGPGVILGLKKIAQAKGGGLLLLAEMSASGTLAKEHYTQAAVQMAQEHSDYVIGLICLRKLIEDPSFIHLTPGIQLEVGKDTLGQQYQTPKAAIEAGTDILIVGRGIYAASDPLFQAQLYRNAGWTAYVNTLT